MTTLVTITNSSDPAQVGHDICYKGPAGSGILKPGESAETHIWVGTTLKIEETNEYLPRTHGYGANPPSNETSVHIQDDVEIFGIEVKT